MNPCMREGRAAGFALYSAPRLDKGIHPIYLKFRVNQVVMVPTLCTMCPRESLHDGSVTSSTVRLPTAGFLQHWTCHTLDWPMIIRAQHPPGFWFPLGLDSFSILHHKINTS